MKIVTVNNKELEEQFLKLPFKIYKNDAAWVPHLEQDIRKVFDKAQNPTYSHGEAERWVLYNEQNEPIGRIAAFINHRAVEAMEVPVGGSGFFECIDDQAAANKLFNTAQDWLESKGMKGMDGPINFGERDSFWGLLVDGFNHPAYTEPYNPKYYQKLFESYGFQKYFDQYTYIIIKKEFQLGRFEKIAKWVMRKPEYSFRHLEMNNLEKYAEDFVHIYNNAWQKFENFKPITKQQILKTFKQMKPIIIPEFVYFCYVENEPAGMFVLIPEVNQLFKHVGGSMNLIGKLKFMYYKWTKPIDTLRGMVFGILPKYQNLGLDAVMAYQLHEDTKNRNEIQYIMISWIGGFNSKMRSLLEALGGHVHKVHYTYRIYFDKGIEFKPYSIKENEE